MNLQREIIKKIEEHNKIIILRHTKPDPDAIGSQLGLKLLIENSFPGKQVYAAGEEVENLKFLGEMDNINQETYENALIIVCDTANFPRVSHGEFIKKGTYLIKIDHHPDREPYGDLSWVDANFSSTSEMIFDLFLQNKEKVRLSNEAAKLIFAGIIGDTGRFLYNNTTKRTFQYASELLSYDFDPQTIYSKLYLTPKNIAKLKGKILSDFDVTEKGVASFKITKDRMEIYDVDPPLVATLVNTLKDIEGNKIWVLFTELPNEIRVNIRSSETHINDVAYQYNGGGHPLASGATVHSWEEAENLIDDLNKLL